MKFKTQQGNDVYAELVESISHHAARMYEDLSMNQDDLEYDHRFALSVRVEEYRSDSLARAALTAANVDALWCGLQGGMMLATMKDGD